MILFVLIPLCLTWTIDARSVAPVTTCAATSCLVGHTCVETPTGAKCELPKDPGALTCMTVKCAGGHTCQIVDNKPKCTPEEQYTPTCASTTCTGPCRDTPSGPICDPPVENPCNLVDCRSGHICRLNYAGEAECIDPIAGGHITCANVRCAGPCKDTPTGPHCQPRENPCNLVDCPSGATCKVDDNGEAKCEASNGCASMTCPKGQICSLQTVQCIRAPCPPLPRCIPQPPLTCSTVLCITGTTCSMIDGKPKCQSIRPSYDSTKLTIRETGAPPRCTGRNEVYNSCGGCEGTCTNQSPICILMCQPGKCMCKQGFVRQNGQCIPTSQCAPMRDDSVSGGY